MSSESGPPSNAELAEALAPFLAANQVVVKPVSTLSLVYFIYGFYVALFGFCLHTLTRPDKKGERSNRKLHLGWVVSLFLLASTTVVFHTVFHIHDSLIGFAAAKTNDYEPFIDYLNGDKVNYADFVTENLNAIVINIFAESMLIHRCYIIWNSNKFVAIPLIFISFAMNAIGFASTVLGNIGYQAAGTSPSKLRIFLLGNEINNAYAITSAVFNSILTLLTAGRIWWITRQARSMMGEQIDHTYRAIVAIILESGLLYPITQVINIILQYKVDVYARGLSPVDLSAIPIQAAGIAPTLIIVRAAIGKSVESVNQIVSTLRCAEGAGDDGGVNGREGPFNRGREYEKSGIHMSDIDLESTQSDLAAGRTNGLGNGTM
ncbi:hypothetical protein PM082_020158 [Marasmius tenuissimus]|nr:hypothetical protein PM082_020158 [Marasmius tenuissimus]